MMENKYFFYKKVHTRTQSQKKYVLVIFILLQETKNSNYLTKTVLNRTSTAIFNMAKVDLEES